MARDGRGVRITHGEDKMKSIVSTAMSFATLVALITAYPATSRAACPRGATTTCMVDGCPGTQDCEFPSWGPCIKDNESCHGGITPPPPPVCGPFSTSASDSGEFGDPSLFGTGYSAAIAASGAQGTVSNSMAFEAHTDVFSHHFSLTSFSMSGTGGASPHG